MRVRVLGSAAGGGSPQWNCNCHNCASIRNGTSKATARTQSSIAVCEEVESGKWLLLNASPDIGTQMREWPDAHKSKNIRASAIVGVVLVDSQIDHSAGLLSLRENGELTVYCTDAVYSDLTTSFPILNVLQSYAKINRHSIPDSNTFVAMGFPRLSLRTIAVSGKAPPYSAHRAKPTLGTNIALEITDLKSGRKLLYAPGVEAVEGKLEEAMTTADCILIDGTFWTDDEMERHGISKKRAKEMGHLSLSEKGGMIDQLKRFPKARKVFIHINNTNPILDPASEPRKILDDLGVDVAFDGMELSI